MKTEFQTNIILKIKKLRELQGVKQASMARYLGLSRGQIGCIESYKFCHKYTLKELTSLCKLFHCTIQSLLCDKEDPSYSELVNAIIKYQGR